MKHEPFHDPRLSPQQNKAVEMVRNGFSRAEIADEMDIDFRHLATLLSQSRSKGIDVPKAIGGRPAAVTTQQIIDLRDRLTRQGVPKWGMTPLIAKRLGLTPNNVAVRLWKYDKGIFPKRQSEGAHA